MKDTGFRREYSGAHPVTIPMSQQQGQGWEALNIKPACSAILTRAAPSFSNTKLLAWKDAQPVMKCTALPTAIC